MLTSTLNSQISSSTVRSRGGGGSTGGSFRDNRWKLAFVANSGLFTQEICLSINEHCPYQLNK